MKNKDIEYKIQKLVEIASSSGNYDVSPYLHGMANGLILAMSVITDSEPKFLDAPSMNQDDIELINKFNNSGQPTIDIKGD